MKKHLSTNQQIIKSINFHNYLGILLLFGSFVFFNPITINCQNLYFDRMIGNNDPVHYYLGHYLITGSDGLDIHWYGGIRLGDATGNVLQVTNGRVGIGTINPLSKLEVRSGNILVRNLDNTDNNSAIMVAHSINFGDYTTFGTSIRSITLNAGSNAYGMQFYTQESYSTGQTEKMRILGNGNIGIGNLAPAYRLDVAGTFRIDGNSELFGSANKIYGNADLNNYYIGHYAVSGSDGLDIHWYGGIRLGDNTGNVFQVCSGKVSIGTTTPDASALLTVKGNINSREVNVTATAGGADFVFAPNYPIKSIEEVEAYIKENKHLPEIAPAKEMEANGIELGNMNIKLLQKVEELTLYLIEQNKINKEQSEKLEIQNARIKALEEVIEQLKSKQ